MEPGGRRKRHPCERSLFGQRLVKRFLEFRPPSSPRCINGGYILGERVGKSDPEIQTQWVTKDETKVSAYRYSVGNAPDQLINQKSVSSRVVTVPFTGFPEWFLPGQLSDHRLVIQDRGRELAKSRLTGLMRQNMEKGGVSLSAL